MKNQACHVQISEPCRKDWNTIQADSMGKFCDLCSKSVIDFTDKTDEEIMEIIVKQKGHRICGRFNSEQLNRSLTTEVKFSKNANELTNTRLYVAVLFMVFGASLFNWTSLKGQADLNNKSRLIPSVPPDSTKNEPAYKKFKHKISNPTMGHVSVDLVEVQDSILTIMTSGEVVTEPQKVSAP